MEIRIIVVDTDVDYADNFRDKMNTRFDGRLHITSYQSVDDAKANMTDINPELVISCPELYSEFREKCSGDFKIAIFTDNQLNQNLKSNPAYIAKYSNLDDIFDAIAVICPNARKVIKHEGCKVVVFTSAVGGSGATTLALSSAYRMTAERNNAFYFDLQLIGSADVLLHCSSFENSNTLSDVYRQIKFPTVELNKFVLEDALKIDDNTQIAYFSNCKKVADRLAFSSTDINNCIDILKQSEQYAWISVDMDYSLAEDTIKIMSHADSIVFTSDGSEQSNVRTELAINAIKKSARGELDGKIYIVLNKYVDGSSKRPQIEGAKVVSGVSQFIMQSGNPIVQVANSISFEDIVSQN